MNREERIKLLCDIFMASFGEETKNLVSINLPINEVYYIGQVQQAIDIGFELVTQGNHTLCFKDLESWGQ